MGLRLQLRKQQAEAGDIVLLYGDESEALTPPYLARAWAKSGADLRAPAPGQAKKVAMLGSLVTSPANSWSMPARPSAAAISSQTSTPSTKPSMTPSSTSTASTSPIRWPCQESLLSCRRDDSAGARSWPPAHQDWPALGLCARRQALGRIGPPAVAYVYAPDRKASQPIAHLAGFKGVLQVDGYAGYRALA